MTSPTNFTVVWALLPLLLTLALSSTPFAVVAAPPSTVTIGVCLSSTIPEYAETKAAIEFARTLTNLDFSIIPATDILTTEIDCGVTAADAQLAATSFLAANPHTIGMIGGQTEAHSTGLSLAAQNATKPFVAIHSVTPVSRTAPVTNFWTFRLSASDYSQAAGFWDLYAAYLNPTLQENYPVPDQVLVHVLYSADDAGSLAFYNELAAHGRFLGIPITSNVSLSVTGHSVATATSALNAIIANTPSTTNHTLWILTPTTVLSDILTAAATLNIMTKYAWVLSEDSAFAISSDVLSSTLRTQAHGMIGLVRGKGYVAQDRMFSPYPYTDLATNTYNWTGFTVANYGAVYSYPSIQVQFAFDAIGTYARALTTLLAVASGGAVYERGDLILANLLTVSYVGASGPIAFQPNGDRKTVRFDYTQLLKAEPTPGYKVIGAWSPLTGSTLYVRDPPLFDGTLGGNWFLGAPYERVDLAYSSVGFSYSWNSIPVQGVPPPIRYGACVVVSKALDALIVIDGTASSVSTPYNDIWTYNFVTQQWKYRQAINAPSGRNYGGCSIKGDLIYLFGGLSSNGLQGDLWEYQVSTNQWIQKVLPSALAGVSQRAIFGSATTIDGMAMWGGRHHTTVNAEMWTWSTTSESFLVQAMTYDPNSWVQPGSPPYSTDLEIEASLANLIAPITADALIQGREVLILLGGYHLNTSMVFIYENSTNTLTPMYTFGEYPGYRSLTQGVVFGNKLFVNRGWSEPDQKNWPTVYSLNIDCPGVDCGRWELHVTMDDHRDSLPSTLYGENILVFGGWGESVHNDFQLFNAINKNSQTTLHSDYFSAPARKFHSSALIGNQMVVFGGLSNDQKARSESFILKLDDQTWQIRASDSHTPAARYGHSAASIRLEMYTFGGTNEIGTVFSDLNIYSIHTSSWQTYDSSSFSVTVDWPAGRVFHSTLSVDDTNVYIYGGQGPDGTFMTDLWRWDVSLTRFVQVLPSHDSHDDNSTWYNLYPSVTSPIPIDFELVQPLTQSASIYSNGMLYFLGGLDVGSNPSAYVYGYRLPTSDTDLGQWYQLPSMPVPRNQHGATLMSGKIYMYGGLFYEAISSDLLTYDLTTYQWSLIDVSRSWNTPRPMAAGSMFAYGNSITMYGGASSDFQDLHSAFLLLPQTWQYSAGAACTGSDSIINGEPCTECTPGTIPSLQWCIPCDAGYYWSTVNGAPECVPCAPGFAGAIRGAASFALCIPCANGTYSPNPGASECTPCDADKYCPVGSLSQLPITNGSDIVQYIQSQPVPYDTSVSKKVSDDTAILTWVLVAVLAFFAVIYFIITFVLPFNLPMEKLDILYQFNHLQLPRKPMVRRQTAAGGVCSLMAIILVFYLLAVLTLPFSMDNIIETRSLIPNVATHQTFYGDIQATTKLTGYPGACVQPGTGSRCDSGISVDVGDGTTFLNALNASLSCAFANTTTSSFKESCQVSWYCQQCSVPIKDTVTFKFNSANTFATRIDWSFSSSSGYPDQDSLVYGSVSSGDDQIFRGTAQPTQIDIKLSQTLYKEAYSGNQYTGYHLNFIDRTLGDTTVPVTFYASNGVHVSYALELQLQTMNVLRAQKQTTVQFIGSLLGSLSGVIGGIAVVMAMFEDVEELIFEKTKRKKGQGTAAHLRQIFEENDHAVAEKAHKKLVNSNRGGLGKDVEDALASPSGDGSTGGEPDQLRTVHVEPVSGSTLSQRKQAIVHVDGETGSTEHPQTSIRPNQVAPQPTASTDL